MATGNVFLASCDPSAFDRTVRSPVDLGEYPDRPAALTGIDEARIWGVSAGSSHETYFDRMESGDLVIFYADGEYVGVGWIGVAFDDADGWAADTLWEDLDARYVFTVDDFTPISVSRRAVNAIFEYGASYTPQEFMRVADDRVVNQLAAIKRAIEDYADDA